MLTEFSLGRNTASGSVGAFCKLTPGKPWWMAGGVALLASYMINCFYMVVGAWTLEYLWTSITGSLYSGIDIANSTSGYFGARLQESISTVWNPLIWVAVILIINIVVLMRGVQKGIEKMSNMLMPVLFILLLVLCGVSLSLPNAGEGLRYFLQPDFSMITPSVFMNALGQAFFSLSLGMGILITYSAYFPKRDNLNSTAFTIAGCDFLVALLMGFIIFPAVTSFGLAEDSSLDGASLVFITLPEVFAQMPCTQLWSIIFFLLLFIAALTSTISISEVSVLFFQDTMRFSRKKSVLCVILPLFIFSPLCSLSQGVLSDVTICGLTIFDFLDTVATNYMLPTAAFFTCIYAGWILPKNFLRRELTNEGRVGVRIYPIIRFLIRYVAPLLILLIFIYQFI
jgi:NSS family neurotransmitter:Na+ symporter